MRDDFTLSVALPADVRDRLLRLAAERKARESAVAAQAIAFYLDYELAAVDGIKAGLADMTAGRVVPHETAMARLMATIGSAQTTEP